MLDWLVSATVTFICAQFQNGQQNLKHQSPRGEDRAIQTRPTDRVLHASRYQRLWSAVVFIQESRYPRHRAGCRRTYILHIQFRWFDPWKGRNQLQSHLLFKITSDKLRTIHSYPLTPLFVLQCRRLETFSGLVKLDSRLPRRQQRTTNDNPLLFLRYNAPIAWLAWYR